MSPSESYSLLKTAYAAPPPVKDSRGWFGQNAGLVGSLGVDAGMALGLAPFTGGMSIPIGLAAGGAGMLWDHFTKKREMANQQTLQWQGQNHQNYMNSINDGSYFGGNGGGMAGLIGQTQAYTKNLEHPNYKPPVVNPTPVQPTAPQPTPKEPAPGNLNYTPGMSAPR